MTGESFTIAMQEPQQAHEAMLRAWAWVKGQLEAGRAVAGSFGPLEDAITTEQRGYYHAGVLQYIADYAVVNGQKFPMPVWKEWLRDKFLGFKVKTYRDPMTGRKLRRRVRVSTEDLGSQGYARLIELVTAFAATDLGLTIPPPMKPLPKWKRGKGKVDPETGEILGAT